MHTSSPHLRNSSSVPTVSSILRYPIPFPLCLPISPYPPIFFFSALRSLPALSLCPQSPSTVVQNNPESRLRYWLPLLRPFAGSIQPLTHLLSPRCLLRSNTPLHSFVFLPAHSLTLEVVGM